MQCNDHRHHNGIGLAKWHIEPNTFTVYVMKWTFGASRLFMEGLRNFYVSRHTLSFSLNVDLLIFYNRQIWTLISNNTDNWFSFCSARKIKLQTPYKFIALQPKYTRLFAVGTVGQPRICGTQYFNVVSFMLLDDRSRLHDWMHSPERDGGDEERQKKSTIKQCWVHTPK